MKETYRALLTLSTEKPYEELEKCLNHHLEYLIDFDNNDGLCTEATTDAFYNLNASDKNTQMRRLAMLSAILSDILSHEPSDEEIGDNEQLMNVYSEIHNLNSSLSYYIHELFVHELLNHEYT